MDTYQIRIGNITRDLPLVQTSPTTRLPLVEFLGDTELTRQAAQELQQRLPQNTTRLFTCETSSIPLVHTLSELTGLDYEVARKRRRPYMQEPIIQEVSSMTLGVGETLWLDKRRAEELRGQHVTVILDVVSSGGTVAALEKMVLRVGGSIAGRMAVFRQGESKPGDVDIVTVQHLPVMAMLASG